MSNNENKNNESSDAVSKALMDIKENHNIVHNDEVDKLSDCGTICRYATSKKGVDSRSRDINIKNMTIQYKGAVLLNNTQIVLNNGNRYGLIGRNRCGKSTLMESLGARALPIPEGKSQYSS